MQVKIFTIPIHEGDQIEEEMNVFLRSKKVLQMECQLVNNSDGAFWCFCVKYLGELESGKKKKVDYKDVLDEASFRRFSKMRQTRKRIAQKEGIPAYAIFTDEEMAGLARMEELTLSNMKTVKGVGDKKVEKFGQYFITKNENEKSE